MREYFRYVHGDNGRGIGSIAIKESDGYFGVGVTIVHPKDKFSKAEARQIAFDRANECLLDSPYSFFEIIDGDWDSEFDELLPPSDNRRKDVGRIYDTMFVMVEDILMDYARAYYESIKG